MNKFLKILLMVAGAICLAAAFLVPALREQKQPEPESKLSEDQQPIL